MACCCTFTNSVDQQFTSKKAGQELERYRRKGAGPTTRLLLAGIEQAGVGDGTLLDVGAGVGALTFELLDRGFRRAVIVEASAGYTAAASKEATRRGRATDIDFVSGDFLEVAETVAMASVVALDRVVCCYPLYEELLREALRHAERGFAFSYPRDRWYVRAGMQLENVSSPSQERLPDVRPSGDEDARTDHACRIRLGLPTANVRLVFGRVRPSCVVSAFSVAELSPRLSL